MLRFGLTGGIGSGKSTVARALVECGAHLVDTDAIARALTLPGGAGMRAIAATFGTDVLAADGALDRARMRAIAFGDEAARQRLEDILHPLIGQRAGEEAAAARPGQPVVFDVPLLTESRHWRARVQRVIVVDCREATQVARVAARPGWTHESAQLVIAQQATRAARRAIADAVIDNDTLTLDALSDEVRQLYRCWVGP
ncbi:MAG: dephospho-CoA kinase [Burkholderiales bacterium]|nr:dephospho-CoA kinase [Burkholderiales bacterium]